MADSERKKVPFSVRFDEDLFDRLDRAVASLPRADRPSKDAAVQAAVRLALDNEDVFLRVLKGGTAGNQIPDDLASNAHNQSKLEDKVNVIYDTSHVARAAENAALAAKAIVDVITELEAVAATDEMKRVPEPEDFQQRVRDASEEIRNLLGSAGRSAEEYQRRAAAAREIKRRGDRKVSGGPA